MSAISISVKHLMAVLKMPGKIADKIIRALAVLAKLTNNPMFPVASWPANIVSFAQLQINVNLLVTAETAAQNKTGTAAARNEALDVVLTNLKQLMSMVQAKADANPAIAESIILNAGYFVKVIKVKAKQQNDAKNTEIAGTILLTADATGHHEWEMSKDMLTVTNLPGTSTAHTYVYNLTPGDVWYFRNHKVNTQKVTYNWSPWVKLLVTGGGKIAGGGNLPGHAGSLGAATA